MDGQRRISALGSALFAAAAIAALTAVPARPASAQPTVSVNWSDIIGATNHQQFAVNDNVCGDPSEQYEDSTFTSDMASTKIGFYRMWGDTAYDWTTDDAWDQTKVSDALSCSYIQAAGGLNTLITISYTDPTGENPSGVPPWCRNGDGTINDSDYASFCASLVQMVNVTLGLHVKYWEPMNEPDQWPDFNEGDPNGSYDYTPMFDLYNDCVEAMKAVDPTIKCGGPTSAFYWDWLNQGFLSACWSNVDFVSWHNYCPDVNGSLSPYSASSEYSDVMSNLSSFATDISDANADIASARPAGDNKVVLTDNDEFNIPNTYSYTGWRQQFNAGAAYETAAMTDDIDSGIGISALWDDKDDTYGLWTTSDMSDEITDPAYLYTWCNNFLVGEVASSTSSDGDVTCLPVMTSTPDGSGHTNFFLISNTSASANDVVLTHGLSYPQTAELDVITSSMGESLPLSSSPSVTHPSITGSTYTIDMPAFSVGLLKMTGPSVAPGYMQGSSNWLSSGSSITCAYPSSQTAGDMNIVTIGSESPSLTVTSVTDSEGNTYTKAIGPTTSSLEEDYIYYAPDIKAGSNTVTVNFSGTASWADVMVNEYSGVNTLDKAAGGSGSTGTTAITGSVTTTEPNELLFMADYASTVGAGSGFYTRLQDGFTHISADELMGPTGTYGASAELYGTNPWVIQLATFYEGSSAPGTPTNLAAAPGNGSVALTWTAGTGDATFNVYRGTTSGGETQYATGITSPSYTDSSVTNGTTYYYYVKGVNSGDNEWSPGSNEVSARPVATMAYRQSNSNCEESASSMTCSYSSSQSSGDMNIVVAGTESPSLTVSSVTDSEGNTYYQACGATTSGQDSQEIYYAPNIKSGSDTVTVTFSGTTAWPDVRILEYSGVYALDKTATGTGNSGTAATTSSVSTSVARELLFMGDTTSGDTTGIGSSFTQRIQSEYTNMAGDRMVSSTGSYSASATLESSDYWVIQMATFD